MKHGFNQVISRRGARRSFPVAVVALTTVVLAGALPAVAMAGVPSGTPRQGQTLTATPDNTGDTITWFSCDSGQTAPSCSPVTPDSGTNTTQYTLTKNDVGNTIATQDATTSSAPSTPTAIVFPILLTPVIGGTAAIGHDLTAFPQWSVAPPPPPSPQATIHFTWRRCDPNGTNCSAILGAIGQTYTLVPADGNHRIDVRVSDTDPGGAPQGPATSAPTALIPPPPPPGTPPPTPTSTSTSIVTSPASASTNQAVTLIATVTAAASGKSPSGTVTFANRGLAIPGCGFVPASSFGQSVTVTCTTSFPAASSAEQLTAAFTPNSNSGVTGSTSAPTPLTIRPDSTTSAVDVSNPTVALGHTATFTATVQGSLAGAVKPSGTVEFLDQGKPIAPCAKQPLAAATVGSRASCVVRYQSTGSHAITVAYPGDANFTGSGSQFATPVSARRIAVGTVSSTMQWRFRVTRSYTRVLALLIDSVSAGTNVAVSCQGKGCPFARRSTTIHQTTRCVTKGKSKGKSKGKTKGKRKCTIQRARSVDLQPGFSGRRVHPGARITIFLTRPQFVGKYYQFSIRPSGSPRIRIACLAPGSTTPGVGC
jgi:hypothetical protein